MVVSAIDDAYNYFSKYQYQVFGQVVSAEKFADLLRKYGIRSTGNAYNDVRALYSAMQASAETLVNSKMPMQEGQAQGIVWSALMSQIGLSASGELADD